MKIKAILLAAVIVAGVPAFALAEHRYDRGDRYRSSGSRFSVSLGFSSGGHYYRDRSFGHVSYSRGYVYSPRPIYRERVYVPAYSYCPPPRRVYAPPVVYAPVYTPPPVVYAPVYEPPPVVYAPVYEPRYTYTPRSYVHVETHYSYRR